MGCDICHPLVSRVDLADPGVPFFPYHSMCALPIMYLLSPVSSLLRQHGVCEDEALVTVMCSLHCMTRADESNSFHWAADWLVLDVTTPSEYD